MDGDAVIVGRSAPASRERMLAQVVDGIDVVSVNLPGKLLMVRFLVGHRSRQGLEVARKDWRIPSSDGVGKKEFAEVQAGLEYEYIKEVDRHRGSGRPLTPATPPCVRVRTRRFEGLR